jgi:hypothetical protein
VKLLNASIKVPVKNKESFFENLAEYDHLIAYKHS